MAWHQWFYLVSLASCITFLVYHLTAHIRLGNPRDLAVPAGKISTAVRYSFSGAMDPRKKESAYLHLPTYTAGIIYHIGTFLSLTLTILLSTNIPLPSYFGTSFAIFLSISAVSGSGVLIKRIRKKGMRTLSSPDDYISNLLVTGFQVMTAGALVEPALLPAWHVMAGLLFIYLPAGKLKHAVYFFSARYHLGLFYGRRGVWPPRDIT